MRALESENAKLKRLLADAMLDQAALCEDLAFAAADSHAVGHRRREGELGITFGAVYDQIVFGGAPHDEQPFTRRLISKFIRASAPSCGSTPPMFEKPSA